MTFPNTAITDWNNLKQVKAYYKKVGCNPDSHVIIQGKDNLRITHKERAVKMGYIIVYPC